jgi:hypothetical protein
MGGVQCVGIDSNTKKLITFTKTSDLYNNIAGRQNTGKKGQSKEFLIQGNELKLNEHMSNITHNS